ncbi:hypothetical protein EFB08_06615 [Rufibacter latericius]|uniref:Uncharacterized protein n=1 Tax=Rufibacter latericius TaxID=2487040 RepID=A0A3M9MUB6_9BACT|nr:hypothetical protein EFB08_06615 [Rufibacter latericius]
MVVWSHTIDHLLIYTEMLFSNNSVISHHYNKTNGNPDSIVLSSTEELILVEREVNKYLMLQGVEKKVINLNRDSLQLMETITGRYEGNPNIVEQTTTFRRINQ